MPPKHTQQRWLEMRPHIEYGYDVMGWTCENVVRYMKEEFDFEATPRMFKSKFVAWDLQGRTVRRPEWAAMDAVYQARAQYEYKDTAFLIVQKGGKPLTRPLKRCKKDIDRYYKRAKREPLAYEEAISQIPEGTIIQWYTPTASPEPESHLNRSGTNRSSSPASSNDLVSTASTKLHPGTPAGTMTYGSQVSPAKRACHATLLESLELGMQSLALSVMEPNAAELSKDDELSLNQISLGLDLRYRYPPFLLNVRPPSSKSWRSANRWVAKYYMACRFIHQGNPDMAKTKREEATEIFEEMLKSPDDCYIHVGLICLTSLIRSHGNDDLLEDIMNDSCRTIHRLVGHNPTYSPLYDYVAAKVSGNMEAIPTLAKALPRCHGAIKVIWGEDSPNSLICEYVMAWDLLNSGRSSEAATKLNECLVKAERLMTKRHITTICCLNLLHHAYGRMGDLEHAATLLSDAVSRCRPALGRENPFRLELLSRLAALYRDMGMLEEAQQHYREVVECQITLLGLFNECTWWNINQLTALLVQLGRKSEADDFKQDMDRRHEEEHYERLRLAEAGKADYGVAAMSGS